MPPSSSAPRENAPAALRCSYAFAIPLPSPGEAERLLDAVRFAEAHARFETAPEFRPERFSEVPDYEWEMPGAPPASEDPERSRAALALIKTVWENAEGDGDVRLDSLALRLRGNALLVETREGGAMGSVNLAVALIQTAQAEFNAPALWFSFQEREPGFTRGGAVFIAPGAPPESLDIEDWALEKESAHARQAAAEPEAGGGPP